jgi:Transketolase, pyrimidine binding domain
MASRSPIPRPRSPNSAAAAISWGEVGNSTYSALFKDAFPDRYFEMYVAEQQMVAAAIGLQARGQIPFASAFAAFWTRAHDFIRSDARIRRLAVHTMPTSGRPDELLRRSRIDRTRIDRAARDPLGQPRNGAQARSLAFPARSTSGSPAR